MVKGLYTAYTGLINEQNRMDVLTNNLANSATTGFKKEGTTSQSFDDVLAYKIKDTSEASKLPKQLGMMNFGVKIGENYTDYTQGSFRITNNQYDVALAGDGFFTVTYKDKAGETSTKYTRDGNFTLNANGFLVTQDGDQVMGTNGPVKLNTALPTDIDTQGRIYQNGTYVTQLKITDFKDYNYLEKYGENFYQPVEGATVQNTQAQVQQGYLEASNVQVVSEMVDMIAVTRAYETNQKIMQTYDDTLDVAVNQLGRMG